MHPNSRRLIQSYRTFGFTSVQNRRRAQYRSSIIQTYVSGQSHEHHLSPRSSAHWGSEVAAMILRVLMLAFRSYWPWHLLSRVSGSFDGNGVGLAPLLMDAHIAETFQQPSLSGSPTKHIVNGRPSQTKTCRPGPAVTRAMVSKARPAQAGTAQEAFCFGLF